MTSAAFGTPTLNTLLSTDLPWISLLGGLQWANSNITYSFLSYGSYYSTTYPDKSFWDGISPFDNDQIAAFRSALSAWSNVANVNFTQVADSSTVVGTLRVGFSSTYAWGNAAAVAYRPNSAPSGGDIFLNPSANESGDSYLNTFRYSDFTPGSYGAMTMLHEIGHAIGLKHPFEATATNSAINTSTLSSVASSTVMSYSTDALHPDVIGLSMYPSTMMPADIVAVQYLYGANQNFNAGDTLYSFNDVPGTTYFQTIWDGGGKNTIAFTGSMNSIVDLREGRGSFIGNLVYERTATRDYAYTTPNIYIAYGTKINSVRLDGVGNDYITLNSNGNAVSAGAGNDTIISGGGNDTIDGGAGFDQVAFSGQQSEYRLETVDGGYSSTLVATGATTILRGIETLIFNGSQVQVSALNNAPNGTVQIVGNLTRGATLSFVSSLSDQDGMGGLAIQWKSDGSDIVGATGSSLLLGADQLGKRITVSVSYTDGRGQLEAVSSQPSAVVLNSASTENGAPTFAMARIGANFDLGSDDKIAAVATLADGKLLVSGTSGQDFFVARFNANGTVDTSYGLNGKTKVNVDSSDLVRAMAVQADGSVIVVGDGSSISAAMARFNANGTLDTSFGTLGFVANATAPDRYKLGTIAAIAMQPDGKFIVGGSDFLDSSFGLARYNSNGSLDLTFGTSGLVKTIFGTGATISSLTVLPNGKILAAGQTNTGGGVDCALVRYNVDGTIDTSFAFDGFLTLNSAVLDVAHSILPLADGKFLICGISGTSSYSANGLSVMRINANGTLDTTFDGDGQVSIPLSLKNTNTEQGRAVLQSDGKILLIATVTGALGADVMLVRLNADGSLDTAFNGLGKVRLDLSADDMAFDILVQKDGKIVIAGASGAATSHDMALVRLNTDGTVDRTFISSNNTALSNTLDNAAVFVETRYTFSKTPPVVLDSNVQIYDLELGAIGSFDGSSLTLSRVAGANSFDEFSALTGGTMQALVAGSSLVVNGISIGTVFANGSGRLELRFGPAATQSLVSQALQQIAYYNSSNAPEATVDIQWFFSDGNLTEQGSGGAASAIGHTVVTITPTNDAPVYVLAYSQNLVAGRPFSYTLPENSFSDPDGDRLVFSSDVGSGYTPWLQFDPTTRTLSGTPDYKYSEFSVGVTVTDPSGETARVTLRMYVQPYDTEVPKLSLTYPVAAGRTGVVELYFSEVITRGSGILTLTDQLGKVLQTVDVSDTNTVQISGSIVTVKFARMPFETYLTVKLPQGVFLDLSGNRVAASNGYLATEKYYNLTPSGSVTISGEATQGKALSVSDTLTDKDGLGTITYQWHAGGVLIPGAVGSRFILAEAQVGKVILVTANYTDGFGFRETVSSSVTTAVQNVNDLPSGALTIKGVAAQGTTLTLGMVSDADGVGAATYQWKADGQLIAGATTATLTLAQAHVGKTISAAVRYVDGHGTVENVTSTETAKVANVNDAPRGSFVISGLVQQGATLTALPAFSDLDGLGTISLQWYSAGVLVPGATGASFTLTERDVDKVVAVKGTYVDGFGAVETVSTSTSIVLNKNDPGSITVSGQAGIGARLTGQVMDPDGTTTISYRWQKSPDGVVWTDITGGNASTFTIGSNDEFDSIRLNASYTDGHGTVEDLFSIPTGGAGKDKLMGTSNSETLWAGAGNDFIIGAGGDDSIDGGTGIDTASLAGFYANYSISRIAGTYRVTDLVGTDGVDTLTNVERLRFEDITFAFDTGSSGNAGQSYRLYQAAFARTPDQGGLGYWIAAMDNGASLAFVAANFIGSAEYKALYPSTLSYSDLIGRYYQNILGRPAEQAGLDYWVSVLERNLASVPEVLASISESAENVDALAIIIGNGFAYTPFG